VQEGYIGRIVAGYVYTAMGQHDFTRRQPGWTDMEYMIRDFFSWCWLSGDFIVDQLIHEMDIFTWYSHLKPIQALGTGGRIRKTTGNNYDSFSVDMEFEGGVHVHAIERRIDNCSNLLGTIIQGTKGVFKNINNNPYVIYDLDGNEVWKYDSKAARQQFKQHNLYVLEHVNLVNHIRQGKVINQGEATALSSMACMMGRESAYSGKIVTWDELTQSDLNYMPDEMTLSNVDMSKYTVIPLPGTAPEM